jgi:hypothetical protein
VSGISENLFAKIKENITVWLSIYYLINHSFTNIYTKII